MEKGKIPCLFLVVKVPGGIRAFTGSKVEDQEYEDDKNEDAQHHEDLTIRDCGILRDLSG